mmetsp:Transcript_41212/g.93185  ORF Transcript_41212/g.93185 Transcript_41212/m.93185 type:complete len:289 (-) Transcript_41212:291-1157(-)
MVLRRTGRLKTLVWWIRSCLLWRRRTTDGTLAVFPLSGHHTNAGSEIRSRPRRTPASAVCRYRLPSPRRPLHLDVQSAMPRRPKSSATTSCFALEPLHSHLHLSAERKSSWKCCSGRWKAPSPCSTARRTYSPGIPSLRRPSLARCRIFSPRSVPACARRERLLPQGPGCSRHQQPDTPCPAPVGRQPGRAKAPPTLAPGPEPALKRGTRGCLRRTLTYRSGAGPPGMKGRWSMLGSPPLEPVFRTWRAVCSGRCIGWHDHSPRLLPDTLFSAGQLLKPIAQAESSGR